MAAGDLSRVALSGSTNGRNIKVAASATPGTLIHTAHATSLDEIWLWAINSDTTDRKLTIEFGGTTDPDDHVEMTVPAESGAMLVISGWLVTGSVLVRAFGVVANSLLINGYVNRID